MNYFIAISVTAFISTAVSVVDGERNELSDAPDYDLETFKENLKLRPQFIQFYAPWCAHCRAMNPVWNDLYQHLVRNEALLIDGKKVTVDVGIAKVDCSKHTKLCAGLAIAAYPSLIFYEGVNVKGLRYKGVRQLEKMAVFVQRELGLIQETAEEKLLRQLRNKGEPKVYTEENFKELVSTGHHFIKFYAPWCSFCQKMAPIWTQLAAEFHLTDKKISIAKVDCTKNMNLCQAQDIKGYPTLLWYTDGSLSDRSYKGDRSYFSLKTFVDSMSILPKSEALKENKITLDDTPKDEASGTTDPAAAVTAVTSLTNDNYVAATKGRLTVIKFFVPGCGQCKEMASDYEEMANKLRNFPVLIAEVNCESNKAVCDAMKIRSYPTIVAYPPKGPEQLYKGERNLEAMSAFVMSLMRVEL